MMMTSVARLCKYDGQASTMMATQHLNGAAPCPNHLAYKYWLLKTVSAGTTVHCQLDYFNAVLAGITWIKWLQSVQNTAVIWHLEHDSGTPSLQFYTASIGFCCGKGSFSRLWFVCRNAAVASCLHVCKNSAWRWRKLKDVLDCGRHQLEEYRCWCASAASPSTGPQCRTICRQQCMTAACHWTCFSGGWRLICLDSCERHIVMFLCSSAIRYKWLTYLCPHCSQSCIHLFSLLFVVVFELH